MVTGKLWCFHCRVRKWGTQMKWLNGIAWCDKCWSRRKKRVIGKGAVHRTKTPQGIVVIKPNKDIDV